DGDRADPPWSPVAGRVHTRRAGPAAGHDTGGAARARAAGGTGTLGPAKFTIAELAALRLLPLGQIDHVLRVRADHIPALSLSPVGVFEAHQLHVRHVAARSRAGHKTAHHGALPLRPLPAVVTRQRRATHGAPPDRERRESPTSRHGLSRHGLLRSTPTPVRA